MFGLSFYKHAVINNAEKSKFCTRKIIKYKKNPMKNAVSTHYRGYASLLKLSLKFFH